MWDSSRARLHHTAVRTRRERGRALLKRAAKRIDAFATEGVSFVAEF